MSTQDLPAGSQPVGIRQQVKKGKASALTGIAAAVSLFTLIIIFSCGVLAGVLI